MAEYQRSKYLNARARTYAVLYTGIIVHTGTRNVGNKKAKGTGTKHIYKDFNSVIITNQFRQ